MSSPISDPPHRALALIAAPGSVAAARGPELLRQAGFSVHLATPGSRGAAAVVVLDAPARGGAAASLLKSVRKRFGGTPVVVILPAGATPAAMRGTIAAGAHGVVLDDHLDPALAPTVAAAAAGQLVAPRQLTARLAPQALSHRERQIVALLPEGLTNREIARRLFLSESTVKTHVSAVLRKLDASSRAEAAARLRGVPSRGLDELPERRDQAA